MHSYARFYKILRFSGEQRLPDIQFVESICTPEIVSADVSDKLDLNTPVIIHSKLRNPISRHVERHVRVGSHTEWNSERMVSMD